MCYRDGTATGGSEVPFSLEEDQPRLRFERNPLESVVWQMRFPPLLLVDDLAFVAKFQAAIRDKYPLSERPDRRLPATSDDSGETAEPDPAPWHFLDETEAWTVALHEEFLAIETSEYVRFEDFRARLEWLLATTEELLELTHTSRLGLRYIDRISLPGAKSPADFARYLNQDLIGVVAGGRLSPYVLEAMQFIRLGVSSHDMSVRHGFVGPGTGHEDAPFYLIDIDAYRFGPERYDRANCLETAEELKRYSWNFFRQSIQDELVEYLRPVGLDA